MWRWQTLPPNDLDRADVCADTENINLSINLNVPISLENLDEGQLDALAEFSGSGLLHLELKSSRRPLFSQVDSECNSAGNAPCPDT